MASKNKRKQTFKEEYSCSWDFIKPSRKGENHARCTLCSAVFSIAASGRYDITQHIATAKHQNEVKEACLCMFLKNTGFYWKIQVCGLQNTGLYFQRLAYLLTITTRLVHVILTWRACDTHVVYMWCTHLEHSIICRIIWGYMKWEEHTITTRLVTCDTHMTCMWYPCCVHVMHTFGAFYHLPHYMRLYEIMGGAYNNYKVSYMWYSHDVHVIPMWCTCDAHICRIIWGYMK